MVGLLQLGPTVEMTFTGRPCRCQERSELGSFVICILTMPTGPGPDYPACSNFQAQQHSSQFPSSSSTFPYFRRRQSTRSVHAGMRCFSEVSYSSEKRSYLYVGAKSTGPSWKPEKTFPAQYSTLKIILSLKKCTHFYGCPSFHCRYLHCCIQI